MTEQPELPYMGDEVEEGEMDDIEAAPLPDASLPQDDGGMD